MANFNFNARYFTINNNGANPDKILDAMTLLDEELTQNTQVIEICYGLLRHGDTGSKLEGYIRFNEEVDDTSIHELLPNFTISAFNYIYHAHVLHQLLRDHSCVTKYGLAWDEDVIGSLKMELHFNDLTEVVLNPYHCRGW